MYLVNNLLELHSKLLKVGFYSKKSCFEIITD